GDWTAHWDEQLGRYKLTNYTGDKTNVQVPTTFNNKPVAISLVEMSNALNLKGLTSFSATGTNKEIKVLDTDWSNLFKDSKATTIDMRGFDVSNVTNMNSLFRACSSLTTLEVSNWDTSNVINMESMIQDCAKLTTLDVSKWDTSKVTNMRRLFIRCSNLTNLDVSKWDTSKVTDMYGLFSDDPQLSALDVSNWNTSKVTNMDYLFENCTSLTSLDLSNFDTSKVTSMTEIFKGLKNCLIYGEKANFTKFSKINLDASNLWPDEITKQVNALFIDSAHTRLNDGVSQTTINTAKSSVEALPDTETNKQTLLDLVTQAQKLFNELEIEGDWSAQWDEQLGRYKLMNYTGDKTDVQVPTTFKNKPVAISLVKMSDTLNLKGLTSFSATGTNKEIKVLDTSLNSLFAYTKATTIDMRGFDTANVTNMAWMFRQCSNLTNVDVSNLDTSNVTNMEHMFTNCTSLTSVDVSNWDVSNVTTMSAMFGFDKGSKIQTLDLSGWDVSNVTTMRNMFYNCGKLTNLNLSGWSPSSLTNTDQMFYYC
ncbi:BspA family leucine-rich repeat surface protein, partial [Enterococcus faecium]|nr:BspA family leucine-rich repeat surface protein [Enterococcus faecium]